MAADQKKISSDPLFKRIGKKKGSAALFAAKLTVSEQALSNWKRRGIPRGEVPRVAAALGMSTETYLSEAGVPTVLRQEGAQYSLESATLLEDFNALPSWLQAHIARKTAELRKYADALPTMVREGMNNPPKDPERYRDWERRIEDDMLQRSSGREL
jgi:hypothetical protein